MNVLNPSKPHTYNLKCQPYVCVRNTVKTRNWTTRWWLISHHPRQKKNQELSACPAPCTVAWTLNPKWPWCCCALSALFWARCNVTLENSSADTLWWTDSKGLLCHRTHGHYWEANPCLCLTAFVSITWTISPRILEVTYITVLNSIVEYKGSSAFQNPLSSKGEGGGLGAESQCLDMNPTHTVSLW